MTSLLVALVVPFCLAAPKSEKETPAAQTPTVVLVKAQAWLETGRDEELKIARPGVRLVERAELKTADKGEIRLKLDNDREVRMMSSTQVTIPGIRWEGGEVPIVILHDGILRWTSKSDVGPRLQTPIFDLVPPKGDFVFSYDAAHAHAELWVIDGEMSLSAMNAEDSVLVKAHQKAWFHGVIEDGEVAADLLLKGRKIPRGKLSKATELTTQELRPYIEEEKIHAEEVRKRQEVQRKRDQNDVKEGVICGKPRARFNECAWTCDGNPKDSEKCRLDRAHVTCVRRRCNASGVWAEPKTLESDEARNRCKLRAVVGDCDY